MASKTGSSLELVKCVVSSMNGATIRSGISEDVVMFTTALGAELEHVARSYTGCEKTEEFVWDECLDFIVTRFGHLNIKEIRHAFRLAASGSLGSIDLRSYYGVFTVSLLGEVLESYLNYRLEIFRIASRLNTAEVLIEQKSSIPDESAVESWKDNRIKLLLSLDSVSLDDVFVYDYTFLSDRGLIDLSPDDKWLVWDRARVYVVREITAEASGSNSFKSRSLMSEIKQADEGNPSTLFTSKQKAISQRLAVLDWIAASKSNS